MLDSDAHMEGIEFIDDKHDINIHDRELKLYGLQWFSRILKK